MKKKITFSPVYPSIAFILLLFLIIRLNFSMPTLFPEVFFYEILFSSVAGGLIALTIALYMLNRSYETERRMEYQETIQALNIEVNENFSSINVFCGKIDELKKSWETGETRWIGKGISLTNWAYGKGNFQYKYLPSTVYYYIINQGFFFKYKGKYCNIDITNLAYFYETCIQFSTELQINENKIRNYILTDPDKKDVISLVSKNIHCQCNSLDDAAKFLKNIFYNQYYYGDALNPGFKSSYESLSKSLDICISKF